MMRPKRHIIPTAKSKEITSAVVHGEKLISSAVVTGGKGLLSKANSARKFVGHNVLGVGGNHNETMSEEMMMSPWTDESWIDDEDEDERDFRWSMSGKSDGVDRQISDVDDDGDDNVVYSDDEDSEDDYNDQQSKKNKKRSSALGASSAHSTQSRGLGTISEDDDCDDGSGKKKKKKKSGGIKKRSDRSRKRSDRSQKRSDRSPKRKIDRAQSERTPTSKSKSKSYDDDDDNDLRMVGQARSKSAQSERKVGGRSLSPKRSSTSKVGGRSLSPKRSSTSKVGGRSLSPNRLSSKSKKSSQSERILGTHHNNDEFKVGYRQAMKKATSKKLKNKDRSKSPMKIDFTGQVTGALNDDKNDDDSDSNDSYIDPITRANIIAENLSLRFKSMEKGELDDIEETEPVPPQKQKRRSSRAALLSIHNDHITGEGGHVLEEVLEEGEEGDTFLDTTARSSGGSKARGALGSFLGRGSGTSFSNKLRTSMFSDTSSFLDELSGLDDLSHQNHRESLDKEKKRVSTLLDELEAYEKELSQEHTVLELERESLEYELNKQTDKNQELEAAIEEMKAKIEELESALKNQEDDQMLLVENEILKKRLDQKESAMLNMSMHSMNPRSNDSMANRSHDSSDSHLSLDSVDEESEDEGYEKPSAKLQGDLLQARAKLTEKDRTIKAQAEEIRILQNECEDYKDDDAREKMKSYIEGLEKEKKFFLAEITKLKEANEIKAANEKLANEKAAMESSSSSIPPLPFQRQSITEIVSLGMASVTEISTQNSSTQGDDLSNDSFVFGPGMSSQNFNSNNRRGSSAWMGGNSSQNVTSSRRGSTYSNSTNNRRQSGSAWRSFSTRLFGGNDEEGDDIGPPLIETEADKMLDDLTKDL
mmetsp:Transcript_27247/g.66134  ORF Transcript_27247/g.66134 Transcript_27247/m.66134 type:complete len:876 (-) Transcript_27247:26-2653(-)